MILQTSNNNFKPRNHGRRQCNFIDYNFRYTLRRRYFKVGKNRIIVRNNSRDEPNSSKVMPVLVIDITNLQNPRP